MLTPVFTLASNWRECHLARDGRPPLFTIDREKQALYRFSLKLRQIRADLPVKIAALVPPDPTPGEHREKETLSKMIRSSLLLCAQ